MRRRILSAVAYAVATGLAVAALAVPFASPTANEPLSTTIVENFRWILSSPGTDSQGSNFPTYTNGCEQEAQAACQRMLDAVDAMVVNAVVNDIVTFVSPS